MYKPPLCVLVTFQEDTPVFGQIMDILRVHGDVFLVVDLFRVVIFNSHYHAYEVTSANITHIVNRTHLHDFHPLCLYQPYNSISTFIALKYYVAP